MQTGDKVLWRPGPWCLSPDQVYTIIGEAPPEKTQPRVMLRAPNGYEFPARITDCTLVTGKTGT